MGTDDCSSTEQQQRRNEAKQETKHVLISIDLRLLSSLLCWGGEVPNGEHGS